MYSWMLSECYRESSSNWISDYSETQWNVQQWYSEKCILLERKNRTRMDLFIESTKRENLGNYSFTFTFSSDTDFSFPLQIGHNQRITSNSSITSNNHWDTTNMKTSTNYRKKRWRSMELISW